MSGLIPRSFINDILARIDIVDVVDARVKLKKKGKNHSACCPFHSEKTPSFTVSQEKQFYHCFGCGEHGNAIDFLMKFDNLEFVEAIEELASQMGIEVPREHSSKNQREQIANRKNYYQILKQISEAYCFQLQQDANKQALEYAYSRGLSLDIIQKYNIGFAPNSWNFVKNSFGRDDLSCRDLVTTGMLIDNDGKVYDRFRNRLIFPIQDRRGRFIGFGGRVFGDDKPKYLNSPETPIYHKGKELYGLYQVLQNNPDPAQILVVEGYMDVVALSQYKIDYAVASLGTATTGEQIQLMFRNSDIIICCYDGDSAGKEAAWRTLENALPFLQDGKQLKFMFLPDNEDPDSFIRSVGFDGFVDKQSQALTLSAFIFKRLMAQVDTSSKEGQARLTTLAKPIIEKIPGDTIKFYLYEILAQKLGIPDVRQVQQLLRIKPQKASNLAANYKIKKTPMRVLIALVIQNPYLAKYLELETLASLNIAGADLLIKIVEKCIESPNINTGQLIELWRNQPEEHIIAKLAVWDLFLEKNTISSVFTDVVDKLINQRNEIRIAQLQSKARESNLTIAEKQELQLLISN